MTSKIVVKSGIYFFKFHTIKQYKKKIIQDILDKDLTVKLNYSLPFPWIYQGKGLAFHE